MLSIFIVNYNTYNETSNCISSIINSNLSNLKYEIIILENNSKKNIYKYKNNNIKVFYLGKNYGFAKAANYGISKANYKYILSVNPDVTVGEDSISTILSYIKNNKNIGVVGPRVLNEDLTYQYSSRREFPYLKHILFKFFLLDKIGFKSTYNYINVPDNLSATVDSVSGCFFITSKDVIKNIGLFDERFFLYFEDTDFCLRAKNNGYDVVYYPKSSVVHKKFGSRNIKNYLFVKFHFFKSFFKFYNKYLSYYLRY